MEIKKILFQTRSNETGVLSFLESGQGKDIPFPIQRIYYICDVTQGARRGFHAHKELEQILICLHGSCHVLLDDGRDKAVALLDSPEEGLIVSAKIWHEMYNFTSDAVLLVLASAYYDEGDYLRDYTEFINFVGGDVRSD